MVYIFSKEGEYSVLYFSNKVLKINAIINHKNMLKCISIQKMEM